MKNDCKIIIYLLDGRIIDYKLTKSCTITISDATVTIQEDYDEMIFTNVDKVQMPFVV